MMTVGKTLLFLAAVAAVAAFRVSAFQRTPTFSHTLRLYSSTGDGSPPPPENNSGEWGDFLNPKNQESESMQRAREFMSDESLPISYDVSPSQDKGTPPNSSIAEKTETPATSSLVHGSASLGAAESFFDEPSTDILANNPFMMVVSNLAPSDLISKFTTTAHPRVQNAVRATILSLIGNLPKLAFDTKTITTGKRLASLMFQLQMTGYMFKNAEYRLSLSQSLGMNWNPSLASSSFILAGSDDDIEEGVETMALDGKVRGKIKIRYGGSNNTKNEENNSEANYQGFEMEVDAAAFTSELRSEVIKLREALTIKRQAKEEALRKDLLMYIRTLPAQELQSLTSTITEDVLVAMKGLVNVVMTGIGEGDVGPDTVTEQSGESMAQLCMWQLVVGYNMRELEVREQMKNSFMDTRGKSKEGLDLSGPGVLE